MTWVTILVRNTLRTRLKQIGRKGQSYSDIIEELLSQTSKNNIGLVSDPPRTENQTVALVGVL
jgi:predicted CopG family antitoxin